MMLYVVFFVNVQWFDGWCVVLACGVESGIFSG